jgi:hypothetical protein
LPTETQPTLSTESGPLWPYWQRPVMLDGLAIATLAAGDAAETPRVANEALQVAERTGERWFDAELWRVPSRQVTTLLRVALAEGTSSAVGLFAGGTPMARLHTVRGR